MFSTAWIAGFVVALIVIGIAVAVYFIAFKKTSVDLSTPEATVNSYFDAFNNADTDALAACYTTARKPNQAALDAMSGILENLDLKYSNIKLKTSMGSDGKTADVTVEDCTISGAGQSITMSQLMQGQTSSVGFKLIKAGDEWLINEESAPGFNMPGSTPKPTTPIDTTDGSS